MYTWNWTNQELAMNKKHCKVECNEVGICQTCGDVFDGTKKRCSLELNDYDGEWVYPTTPLSEKLLMLLIAIAGAAGMAKALGWW